MIAMTLNAFGVGTQADAQTTEQHPNAKMQILIVYYSLYGHVFKLAQAVKEGAESVKG